MIYVIRCKNCFKLFMLEPRVGLADLTKFIRAWGSNLFYCSVRIATFIKCSLLIIYLYHHRRISVSYFSNNRVLESGLLPCSDNLIPFENCFQPDQTILTHLLPVFPLAADFTPGRLRFGISQNSSRPARPDQVCKVQRVIPSRLDQRWPADH